MGLFPHRQREQARGAENELKGALERARELGDRYAEAHSLLGLAFAAFQRGRNNQSETLAVKAGEIFHELGSGWADDTLLPQYREIDCLARLSMIYRKTMDYEKGIRIVRQALDVVRASRKEDWQLQDWEGELYSQLGFHSRALGELGSASDGTEQSEGAIGITTGHWGLFQRQFG